MKSIIYDLLDAQRSVEAALVVAIYKAFPVGSFVLVDDVVGIVEQWCKGSNKLQVVQVTKVNPVEAVTRWFEIDDKLQPLVLSGDNLIRIGELEGYQGETTFRFCGNYTCNPNSKSPGSSVISRAQLFVLCQNRFGTGNFVHADKVLWWRTIIPIKQRFQDDE